MVHLFAVTSTLWPHRANTSSKDRNCVCTVSCSVSALKTGSDLVSVFSKQGQGNEGKNLSCFLLWELAWRRMRRNSRSQTISKKKKPQHSSKTLHLFIMYFSHPKNGTKPLTWDISFNSHIDPMDIGELSVPSVQMRKLRSRSVKPA